LARTRRPLEVVMATSEELAHIRPLVLMVLDPPVHQNKLMHYLRPGPAQCVWVGALSQ
jgi:hypothetical protein